MTTKGNRRRKGSGELEEGDEKREARKGERLLATKGKQADPSVRSE
jgi:hypothetical protein